MDPIELAKSLEKATDKVKDLGTELTGRMEKGEKSVGDLKDQVDNALTAMNEAKLRLDEIEQKQARNGQEEVEEQKSMGRRLFESDEFKAFAADPRNGRSATLQVKELNSATTNATGSAGALTTPTQVAGIVAPPMQQLRIRDLLAPGTTDSNSIEYVRETGFTNGAATQVEGALKAMSDLKFDDKTVNVRTIAHWVKATRQILDDASMLESYIGGRLMYGLKLVEDRQLLNGDGTGSNLHGIIPQATAFANPAAAMVKYTIMDQLRLAQLQAVIAEYPASGHVLNPIDWALLELSKDNEGRYIIGQPQGTATPTMWGLPVVATQAMGVGKFLTGAFSMAAQIFDRQLANVAVATQNEDDFVKNKVTILCEERLALAVYRPEAFIYGTLAAKIA